MKNLNKRIVIAIFAFLILLVLAAASIIVLIVVFEYPGGMRASFRAVNRDTRLTPIAREAAPIIQSINRYYKAHGRCPGPNDPDLAEVRAGLPSNLIATLRDGQTEFREAKAVTGWWYSPADNDPAACELWRKLGWDPALIWRRRGGETKWIFDPGDGSDEKAIDLDAGG
jgi:hypothetical protein